MNYEAAYSDNSKLPDSLLAPSVNELVMDNLDVIENFVMHETHRWNGRPLKMVPAHYEGVTYDHDTLEEVSQTVLSKLHSFLDGSNPVSDMQPYGVTTYWSFSYKDQLICVTESTLYKTTAGAVYQSSRINAGITLGQPDRYKQLLKGQNTDSKAGKDSISSSNNLEIQPAPQPNDILARIGRKLLKLADKIDPSVN